MRNDQQDLRQGYDSEPAKLRAFCAHVVTCFACLRAHVSTCLACSRANVPYVFTCQRDLRAYVLTCLVCLRTKIPCMLKCSNANVLMCLHANVLTWERALSSLFHLPEFFAWLISNFDATFFWVSLPLLLKLYTMMVRFDNLMNIFPK